jgi:ADP-ribose pyrophosphatase
MNKKDDLINGVNSYFEKVSKEQFLQDLIETNSIDMVEDIEENETNYTSSKYVTPDGVPADNVIFTITSEKKSNNTLPKMELKVLLIKRKKWPYAGSWALPGGFSNPYESLLETAKRELFEETNIKNIKVNHLDVYSKPKRDPRGWIISSAYYALINEKYLEHRKASDDAIDEKLFSINEVFEMIKGDENGDYDLNSNTLAFDHLEIIQDAYKEIQREMLQTDIAKEFLPETFTISELFQVVSTVVPILNEIYPKEQIGNFKRKVINRGLIEKVDVFTSRNSRRPAALYKFKEMPILSHYI